MSSSSSAASARPSPGLIERSTGRSVAVRDRVGGPDRPGYEKGPLRARSAMPPGVELLKPITWFAPMWAFGCGVVSSGVPVTDRWWAVLLGVVLAGPMVCGASQAANDWFDRHVDTINEPDGRSRQAVCLDGAACILRSPGPCCRCWWLPRWVGGASEPR